MISYKEKVIELKKAKTRALIFLLKIIDEKFKDYWTAFEKQKEEKYKIIDWPLRFEAYSYIANQDEQRISDYAIEIRDIWKTWIELNNKDLICGQKDIFWPSVYEYISDIDPNGNADRFPGNEIENCVSMYRVKETLGLGGFDQYLDKGKVNLKNMLLKERYYSQYDDNRITWQIIRSPMLSAELKDYLNAWFLKMKERREIKELLNGKINDVFGLTQFSSMVLFFITFSGLEKTLELSKMISSKILNLQERNGSFSNDVLTTCLCASSFYVNESDPSNSVCKKASDYILMEQNKNGSWDFLFGESKTFNVLSTVVALETLDLLSEEKSLPIWARNISSERTAVTVMKQKKIQPIAPIKLTQSIQWNDLTIRFLSKEAVHIQAKGHSEGKDFIEMGFVDRRKREKERSPDLSWQILLEIANRHGEISVNDSELLPNIKRNLKSYIHFIRTRLKTFFGIGEDPFKRYNRKTKSWKTKFIIIDDSQE